MFNWTVHLDYGDGGDELADGSAASAVSGLPSRSFIVRFLPGCCDAGLAAVAAGC